MKSYYGSTSSPVDGEILPMTEKVHNIPADKINSVTGNFYKKAAYAVFAVALIAGMSILLASNFGAQSGGDAHTPSLLSTLINSMPATSRIVYSKIATETGPFTLSSSAFEHNDMLPDTFTCKIEETEPVHGVSPPLTWENAPREAKDFMVVMEKRTGYSWSVYNISGMTSLPANNTCGVIGFCGGTVEWTSEQPPFIDKDNYMPKYIYDEPCSQGPGVKEYVFRIYAFKKLVAPELAKKGAQKSMINPPFILDVMRDFILVNASMSSFVDLFEDTEEPTEAPTAAPTHRAQTMQKQLRSLYSFF